MKCSCLKLLIFWRTQKKSTNSACDHILRHMLPAHTAIQQQIFAFPTHVAHTYLHTYLVNKQRMHSVPH